MVDAFRYTEFELETYLPSKQLFPMASCLGKFQILALFANNEVVYSTI